jgi:dUTP pyrophosphatase
MTFAIDSSRAEFKPAYKTEDAVGFDICNNHKVPFIIAPGTADMVDTGLFVDRPNTNGEHELQIRSRSGLAVKQLFVLNSPGTIDPGYPDEIKIILYNAGTLPYTVEPGDRIAQGVVVKREPRCLGVEIESTERTGGFGSSGK